MKASEVITKIQDIIDEFGDVDVGIVNKEWQRYEPIDAVWYKEADTSGNEYSRDKVSAAHYFIAID